MDCDSCGSQFKRIGAHWAQSECGYPQLTYEKKELLKGLLMGDGTVEAGHGTGRMTLEMTCKPFLEWVDEKLGVLSTGVSLKHTSEEKVKKALDDPFFETVNAENWSSTYVLKTRRHPYIGNLREWYKTGEKRFPSDLTLTPELTKSWYCGDGTLHKTRSNPNEVSPQARFITRNEDDRIDYIQSLFTDIGFDARTRSDGVVLTVDSTVELCQWMGDAPPGMEYKWV